MLISDVSIRRPVFTAMIMGALLVFGVVALRRLGVDLFPKVDFPVITIVTKLPGADPETIEIRVTDPIEEAVNTIGGIKDLRSTSADSFSMVVIQFELEKDIDVAFQEIQARVNTIRQQLPSDIEEPVIEKFDISAAPILTVIVSADLPIRELSHLADKTVKERLQRVRNVGSAKLVGTRDRKLWLWLDPVKLKQHGLTVQDVRSAVGREHIEIPGGRIETGPVEVAARTKAEFASAAELNDLILAERPGQVLRLRDVGLVEDGLEEERSYAQLDNRPCIALQVRRQSGTNTVQVANDVKAEVARLTTELGPRGVRLEIAQDSSIYIEHSVKEVEHHLVVGGLMAVLTVLVFLLNLRSTFICALVLPVSVLSSFVIMLAMGFTINVITLLALTLAIGLLIDDAIVVQENIMRHVEEGMGARRAAGFGTGEIGLAVLATTLSVVAVFLPVTFTKGIVGRFLWSFGMTVSFAVLISMFVSFTLNPMLSSRLLKKPGKQNFLFAGLEWLFHATERAYRGFLGWTLRHRLVVVAAGVLALGSIVVLMRYARIEFQATEDRSEFNIAVRGPQGASLERTRAIMEDIRARLAAVPEVDYVFTTIGADEMQKVNEGGLYVHLKPKTARTKGQEQLMNETRALLKNVPGAQISVQIVAPISGGGMKWAKIQYEVRGPDLVTLEQTADRIIEKLRAAGGYVDVQNSFESNKPGSNVVVDRLRAAQLGVSPLLIADSVNAAIGGAVVGKFRAGGDRYDIAVRFFEQYRNRPDLLGLVEVPSSRGDRVELRNVARVLPTTIPVEITRYNRQRNVTVLANLVPGKALGDATKEIEALTATVGLPPGYSTGWTGEAERMKESFESLLETMALSVIVVFMVLASQFESIVHPFTIMLSLPLAFIGGLGSLLLFRQTITIFVMIGFIFLLGLVTKNAILLVDYANTLRERDGLERDDALLRAGPVRLRPILMTSVSIIAGMLPTALGTGAGAEVRRPMAVAIIGGVITSTVLTLLVVPAVYSLLDPLSELIKRHFLDRREEPAPPPVGEDAAASDGTRAAPK